MGQLIEGGRSMNEEKRSRISAFRFGVIHDLIGDTELENGEQG